MSISLTFLPVLIFLFTTLLVSSIGAASSQPQLTLRGKITDAITGKPLAGVEVHIRGWVESGYEWHRYNSYTYTNETGHYNMSLYPGYYRMSITMDDPETLGMDYLPMYFELGDFFRGMDIEQTEIVADLELYPGATVVFMGSPEFVEMGGVPPEMYMGFGAVDQRYDNLGSRGVQTYYYPYIRSFLGLGPNDVVVVADTPIVLVGWASGDLFFIEDNNSLYFEFPQGSKSTVDISRAVMERNIATVRDRLSSVWLWAKKLSLNGIDVKPEMNDLNTAFDFLNSSRLAFADASYSQCYVSLRAAYIIYEDILTRISNISTDATFSPIPLSFLLMLSGFGLASVIVERNAMRIGAGAFISLLLLGFYYYISPGWRLTDPLLLLNSCISAAFLAIGLALILPRTKRDIVTPTGVALTSNLTSTFSIATRNLKRRRLRSLLILISIVTLVFGFTVFTSFQMQTAVASGRPTTPYPGTPPAGLMVIAPPSQSQSLPVAVVEALGEDPLVSSVAPKAESSPTYMEALITTERGDNITIRGVLGISSDEAKISHLDTAVISGHLLLEDQQAIMISARAAEMLHASPGDRVNFTWNTEPGSMTGMELTEEFMIVGVLDDDIFGQIVELDGQPIRPYVIQDRQKVYLGTDQVAVFGWNKLIDLNIGGLTRINIQPKNESDTVPLAIQFAGKWRWFVYASMGGEVKLFYYNKVPTLAGGTEVPMLLVLVGLNVLACTLNAVYERRREIATLSLVGLNPSQISYMFLAEAGLVAFVGGVVGYLLGLGGPRAMLSIGGPGFLTEKISWTWSVAVILIAVAVSVGASVLPALKASTIATPKLPLRWKLEYIPSTKDSWSLHIPQLISQVELVRFFRFIEGKFEEMQLLRTIPEKMEKLDLVDESDQEKDVKKFMFAHSFAQEGSRSFRTENELIATRGRGSSTYALDLTIRIAMLYNYEPMEVVRKAASAVRKLMLQWAAAPSSERWGQTEEVVRAEGVSVVLGGKAILRRINFNANRGEIVGIVGEGRRALLLAIAGLTKLFEGSVLFRGMDTYSKREEARRRMGIFLQGTDPYGELSLRKNLIFVARLEGVSDVEKAVDDLIERCGLKHCADASISDLSQVDKRKLMIAQALINKPSLLLLEDPLRGLKGDGVKDVVALLTGLSRWEGITTICSGESVDVLGFCDRIGGIKGGSFDMITDRRCGGVG